MPRPGRITLGIILMAGFSFIAPLMDSFAKLIGDAIAVGQVAAVRFVIQSVLLLPLACALGALHRPRPAEIGLHFLRAGLLLVATAAFFVALRHMPVADAISIFFVEPFILILLGRLILGEELGPRRLLACLVGFIGAMVIIRPKFDDLGYIAALPLVTALLFAFYMILTRRMATRMHPITLQAYTGFFALFLAGPILWAFDGSGYAPLDPSWPERREFILLMALGVTATLSHICISYALSLAPASLLAPIQYLEIVGATILGFYIFGDIPDGLTFVGIALIVGSGLFVFIRERHIERFPTPAP